MKLSQIKNYICPCTGESLTLEATSVIGDEVVSGFMRSVSGYEFVISNGVPNFTWPLVLLESDEQTRKSYEDMASIYDQYAVLPFVTYRSDENAVRERMVDALGIQPNFKVLEIGCGTGSAALHLGRRLSGEGALYLQEISPGLLDVAIEKLRAASITAEFSIANGSYLPFPNNFFDAAHHFGGINTFAEIQRCLSELTRVVKPGGKIVIGDEGLGPWLRDTEMGRIMANSNPLLKCEPPMKLLPANAIEVKLEYIMMGAFYVLEFRVAENQPLPDYHMQIPSARGGSHWTRYFGQLEGVSDEAKRMAHEARKKTGKSMHAWLDNAVREAASDELKKNA